MSTAVAMLNVNTSALRAYRRLARTARGMTRVTRAQSTLQFWAKRLGFLNRSDRKIINSLLGSPCSAEWTAQKENFADLGPSIRLLISIFLSCFAAPWFIHDQLLAGPPYQEDTGVDQWRLARYLLFLSFFQRMTHFIMSAIRFSVSRSSQMKAVLALLW